jgi:hypothetical protein
LDPFALTPILDASMTRMGMYARYGGYEDEYEKDIIAIADYLYTQESSSSSVPYDGYLNRSLGCYRMDISSFMQSLIAAAMSTTDENGKVDVSKFETDEDLRRSRRIFVGPAADAMFGFNRQMIVGGDASSADATLPTITLELVYTIVD